MIKRLLTIAISLFLVTPAVTAAEAASEAQFTSNLRAAITQKDNQKLEALICFEGASPTDKQRMTSMLQMTLMNGKDVEEISLEPLPGDFQSVLIVRGQKIEPTAPPVGMVKVTFKGAEHGQGNSSSAYGVVGGKFFLIGMKSMDLGWKGPPDKNIGFSVVGQGSSGVQIHGTWNASGVQLKKAFKESSITFWGQYFEELSVTSGSDDCDVTVEITEDGKAIYSEPLKGKGVLQYKKKS
jgi:hypothetical protein